MFNYVVFIFLLAVPAVAAAPGWFGSVRGGQLSHHPSVYPRALSNIAYAYGHIKDSNEQEEGKEEEVVINVKSTLQPQRNGRTKTSKKKITSSTLCIITMMIKL